MDQTVCYHAGRSAETQVAKHYDRLGCHVCAHRWRGAGGEIDLIVRDKDQIIFVEVKSSRTHKSAIEQLSYQQIERIRTSASIFLGSEPSGQNTPCRFDIALIDRTGHIEVIENALVG